jgi:hypothetical protein
MPINDAALRPCTWYKRFLVEGAREHSLPAEYMEELQNHRRRTGCQPSERPAETRLDVPGRVMISGSACINPIDSSTPSAFCNAWNFDASFEMYRGI